jgi:hypothetical protein
MKVKQNGSKTQQAPTTKNNLLFMQGRWGGLSDYCNYGYRKLKSYFSGVGSVFIKI